MGELGHTDTCCLQRSAYSIIFLMNLPSEGIHEPRRNAPSGYAAAARMVEACNGSNRMPGAMVDVRVRRLM